MVNDYFVSIGIATLPQPLYRDCTGSPGALSPVALGKTALKGLRHESISESQVTSMLYLNNNPEKYSQASQRTKCVGRCVSTPKDAMLKKFNCLYQYHKIFFFESLLIILYINHISYATRVFSDPTKNIIFYYCKLFYILWL